MPRVKGYTEYRLIHKTHDHSSSVQRAYQNKLIDYCKTNQTKTNFAYRYIYCNSSVGELTVLASC